ncbi:X-element\ORF2, partial [Symbiodinium necroappetens]
MAQRFLVFALSSLVFGRARAVEAPQLQARESVWKDSDAENAERCPGVSLLQSSAKRPGHADRREHREEVGKIPEAIPFASLVESSAPSHPVMLNQIKQVVELAQTRVQTKVGEAPYFIIAVAIGGFLLSLLSICMSLVFVERGLSKDGDVYAEPSASATGLGVSGGKQQGKALEATEALLSQRLRVWSQEQRLALGLGDARSYRASARAERQRRLQIVVPQPLEGLNLSEDDLVVNNFGDLRVGSLDSTEQLFLRELCPEAYDLGFRVGDRLLQVNQVPVFRESDFKFVMQARGQDGLQALAPLREPLRLSAAGPVITRPLVFHLLRPGAEETAPPDRRAHPSRRKPRSAFARAASIRSSALEDDLYTYEIRQVGKDLGFEQTLPNGEKITGLLIPDGLWLRSDLQSKDGYYGEIRLQYDPEEKAREMTERGDSHNRSPTTDFASPSGDQAGQAQASPKRAREDIAAENLELAPSGDQPLTLALLQQALQVSQQHITSTVHASLEGSLTTISTRVAQVEANMEEHVKRTTNLLDAMTDRHCHIEGTVKQSAAAVDDVRRRLELLEGKFAAASFTASSTRTTDGGTSDGVQRPAIVAGGWDADQDAETTLKLVREHIERLQVDLDLSEAFVPGLRRGFAIVPINPREGENQESFRSRIRTALRQIREARIVTGDRPEGGNRFFWAAMSESPERRKRAQFSGKVKRLILESQGDRRLVQVEFGTGNVWYDGAKISSAVTTAPPGGEKAGVGWINLPTLARQLGTSLTGLADRWEVLDTDLYDMHVVTWNVGGTDSGDLQCVCGKQADDWRGISGKLTTTSGRGEQMLTSLTAGDVRIPSQQLEQASFFPYNTTMRPRRLDYVATKHLLCQEGRVLSLRELASSDHEPVHVPLQQPAPPAPPSEAKPWGSRRLRDWQQVEKIVAIPPPSSGDMVQEITNLAVQITRPGRSLAKFKESKSLRCRRHRALQMPPGPERKRAWKEVQKSHREEHRAWRVEQLDLAGKGWWRAKEAMDRSTHDSSWELHLRSDDRWRETLKSHFGGIFNKSDAATVAGKLRRISDRLARLCKTTAWIPFTVEELHEVRKRWSGGKACGPDSVSHEALRVLEHDDRWRGILLYVLNDILYTAAVPKNVEKGITVLLAKTGNPAEWSDTRPITLSSALLKTFSQLLIGRVSHLVQLILRRVCRVARDWGIPMYIAKLDIRKSFDSIYQEALAEQIEADVGIAGDHPWEARAWTNLIHANEINIYFRGEEFRIPQTNGVRQGAFMDDSYIWSTRKEHLQALLSL